MLRPPPQAQGSGEARRQSDLFFISDDPRSRLALLYDAQRKAIELVALLSMPPRHQMHRLQGRSKDMPAESPMQVRAVLANYGALQLFVDNRENPDPEVRRYGEKATVI